MKLYDIVLQVKIRIKVGINTVLKSKTLRFPTIYLYGFCNNKNEKRYGPETYQIYSMYDIHNIWRVHRHPV